MGGWQFEIMVEHGMTPMQAIKSATSIAARHMGLDDEVGALQEGLAADIIAVRGNPILDLTQLRHVSRFKRWRCHQNTCIKGVVMK